MHSSIPMREGKRCVYTELAMNWTIVRLEEREREKYIDDRLAIDARFVQLLFFLLFFSLSLSLSLSLYLEYMKQRREREKNARGMCQ